MNNIRRGVIAVVIAGVALTGLAACSSAGSGSSSSETTGSQLVGPIIADLTSLDGKTIDATVGRSIDLTGDDETFDQWSATADPNGIVTFTSGYTSGSASFNPGLTVEAAGTTKVTLTNSTTGQTITFTVDATN